MLESIPYKIDMPVSFLDDLAQIIFNDSLKPNLAKLLPKFYIQERPIQLVKFCNVSQKSKQEA